MPELKIDTLNSVTRYTCPDCGRWAYEGHPVTHSKRCDFGSLQPAAIVEKRARETETERLRKFAREVKRTGMAHGKTDDLLECVRRGFLSQSNAMNLDD